MEMADGDVLQKKSWTSSRAGGTQEPVWDPGPVLGLTQALRPSSGRSSEASESQACKQHPPPDVSPRLLSREICRFPPFPSVSCC